MSALARRIIDSAQCATQPIDGDEISLARGAFEVFENLGFEMLA